jgi:hypothetical protein
MIKQSFFLIFTLLLFSCKRQAKTNSTPKEPELHIVCENEQYLLENINNNLEYSFDTIPSTKSYWKNVRFDQANSIKHKQYPYVIVKPDTPSVCKNIKLSLVGYGEWKSDSRIKTHIDNDRIDSNWISNFYEIVSQNLDTTDTRNKAELLLSFYKDSIVDFSKSLKKISHIYIAFQRMNSKRLFKTDLCDLTKNQLDSIKKDVPYRIRLGRRL